jgi:hypothetical protein
MFQSSSSRRAVLKASAAMASVGVAGALAGCGGGNPLGGDGGGDGGDGGGGGGGGMTGDSVPQGSADPQTRSTLVPSKANGVLHMDMEMMRSNDKLKQLFDAGVEQGSGEQSFDEALSESGIEGIDAEKIYDMIIFGEIPEDGSLMQPSPGEDYAGGIVFTGIESSTALEAMRNAPDVEFTEESYEGHTLLVDESSEQGYLAVVSNGVYAFGTEQSVKDIIDIAEGSGSAMSGDVQSAMTNTRQGALRFAFQVPESDSGGTSGGMAGQMGQSIEVVSGTMLYQAGNNVGLEITLTMTDGDTASQFASQMQAFKQQYKQQYQQSPQGEEVVRLLENVNISQNGNTVTINFEDTVENLIALSEGQGLPMGAGV